MRALWIAGLALGLACTQSPEPSPEAEPAAEPRQAVGVAVALVRVVDGDTIRVRFEGREERVRHIGTDTPD